MSLSEAVAVAIEFHNRDAKAEDGRRPHMTRREIEALTRLITDAQLTLSQISTGVLRREGRR
jgi:hypothetical protein